LSVIQWSVVPCRATSASSFELEEMASLFCRARHMAGSDAASACSSSRSSPVTRPCEARSRGGSTALSRTTPRRSSGRSAVPSLHR
jgi:hypothetical protein